MFKITSSNNPKIKLIKSLYKKRERWKRGLFLVEGLKIVEECIAYNYPLENIIYTDDLLNINGGEDFLQKIKSREDLIYVPPNLFKKISDTETPQGIMAIVKMPNLSMDSLQAKDKPFLLFLDSIQDPGNMGTIIRTGDIFNINGIIVSEGSVDIYNPKVVRSTMGAIFRMPIYHVEDKAKAVERLKREGFKVFATSLEKSSYIHVTDFNQATVVLIGNESQGLSQELYSLAHKNIKIPIIGEGESLNAAIASSIIMYEAIRQRLG